jgi:hypothetical protein
VPDEQLSPDETYFHVSSSRNRASIAKYGLDISRMGAARGIAGSYSPEQQGCFLALDEYERRWFVQVNNTGGSVDVWAVSGVDRDDLVISPENYHFLPGRIPPDRVRLVENDIPPIG